MFFMLGSWFCKLFVFRVFLMIVHVFHVFIIFHVFRAFSGPTFINFVCRGSTPGSIFIRFYAFACFFMFFSQGNITLSNNRVTLQKFVHTVVVLSRVVWIW